MTKSHSFFMYTKFYMALHKIICQIIMKKTQEGIIKALVTNLQGSE